MSVYDTPTLLCRTLLTSILRDPSRAGLTFASVPENRFPFPERYVAQAMTRLRLARTPLTMTALIDDMQRHETLHLFGGEVEVRSLEPGMVYGSSDDDYGYALDHASTALSEESLHASLARATQLLEERSDVDVLDLANEVQRQVEAVKARATSLGDVRVRSLRDLLEADVDDTPDWVIPGLLEHGDRLILTGGEGLGKSTVLRQIAVCAAAGIDPFSHTRNPQKRVLYVDCEVFDTQSRRAFRSLVSAARQLGDDPLDWISHESRSGGMELDHPRDETELVRMVEATMPDLLVVGPLYRLFSKDGNEEDTGRQVTRVLDRCREISRCAIITEAHLTHPANGVRNLRPLGTSLWMRWPEFGYGIRAAEGHTAHDRRVEFVAWRGDRSERDWPTRLKGGGRMPWTVDWDGGLSGVGETMEVPPDPRVKD